MFLARLFFTFNYVCIKITGVIDLKEYEYYLFDFDGTVCDTTEGIFNSVLHSLEVFGIEEPDRKRLDFFIGPPLFASYKKLYNVSDEDAHRLIEIYRDRYKDKAAEESKLYDGIKEMLIELKRRGKKTAIASSKPLPFVEKIAKYHGIFELFDFIAAETFQSSTHSEKKELIEECIGHFDDYDKSKYLMAGDRFYDIEGAQKAGIDSAGAVYGFGTEEELSKAGATYLLFNPEDILY